MKRSVLTLKVLVTHDDLDEPEDHFVWYFDDEMLPHDEFVIYFESETQ